MLMLTSVVVFVSKTVERQSRYYIGLYHEKQNYCKISNSLITNKKD